MSESTWRERTYSKYGIPADIDWSFTDSDYSVYVNDAPFDEGAWKSPSELSEKEKQQAYVSLILKETEGAGMYVFETFVVDLKTHEIEEHELFAAKSSEDAKTHAVLSSEFPIAEDVGRYFVHARAMFGLPDYQE